MPKETFSLQTPETLKKHAENLQRLALKYKHTAEFWEEMGVAEAVVKGETERKRVFRGASQFAENALQSAFDELAKRRELGQPLTAEQARQLLGRKVSDSVSEKSDTTSEE